MEIKSCQKQLVQSEQTQTIQQEFCEGIEGQLEQYRRVIQQSKSQIQELGQLVDAQQMKLENYKSFVRQKNQYFFEQEQ